MLRNGLEPWHLLVVAIVAILLFGSKRLPDAARSLGRSMRILRSEARAMKEDSDRGTDTTPAPAAHPAPSPAPALEEATVQDPHERPHESFR